MLNFDAAIFDMDGVVTQTALVHAAAWKRMFDEYLRYREEKYHEPFHAFSHRADYLVYVDGRPRYQGVEAFLRSRGIELAHGTPADPPEHETICGLGNRKNEYFNLTLDQEGVQTYAATVRLVRELLRAGIKVGIATSIRNCDRILDKAGVAALFETRVDGTVSLALGLKGKPEPDIFVTAARNLGVEPPRAIVFEDAVSGVEAGARVEFRLVIGIARQGNERELAAGGADVVVSDLAALSLNQINRLAGVKACRNSGGRPPTAQTT